MWIEGADVCFDFMLSGFGLRLMLFLLHAYIALHVGAPPRHRAQISPTPLPPPALRCRELRCSRVEAVCQRTEAMKLLAGMVRDREAGRVATHKARVPGGAGCW